MAGRDAPGLWCGRRATDRWGGRSVRFQREIGRETAQGGVVCRISLKQGMVHGSDMLIEACALRA